MQYQQSYPSRRYSEDDYYSGPVRRSSNRIEIRGRFHRSNIRYLTNELYNAITRSGFKDIVLDFSKIDSIFLDTMAPLCLRCYHERENNNISFEIILPQKEEIRRLFINCAWVHLITGAPYEPLAVIHTNIPAIIFKTPEEQNAAVNMLVDSIMKVAESIERPGLAAIEWALGEITDNVITHSQSRSGGVIQLTVFHDKIGFVVADLGVGIPKTLKKTRQQITNDRTALQFAIKEGVTRDKSLGQGNGLFGSFEVSRKSGKDFYLTSARATLQLNDHGEVAINDEAIPFDGTIVAGAIGFTDPHILEKALRFGDQPYVPYDCIETRYENEAGEIVFEIKSKVQSVTVRSGSEHIRQQIKNLMHMDQTKFLILDFSGLSLISSSFADEVIAKLVVEIGFCSFVNRVKFRSVNGTIASLIQRAVFQRFASEYLSGYNENS